MLRNGIDEKELKTTSELKEEIERLPTQYLHYKPKLISEIMSSSRFSEDEKLSLLNTLIKKNSSALYSNGLMTTLTIYKLTFKDQKLYELLKNLYIKYLGSNELALSFSNEESILQCLITNRYSKQLELLNSLNCATRPCKIARELNFIGLWLYSSTSEKEIMNTYKKIKDYIRGKELDVFESNIKEIAKLAILFIKMHAVNKCRKLEANTGEEEVIAFLNDGHCLFASYFLQIYDLIKANPHVVNTSGFVESNVIVKLNRIQMSIDAKINKALNKNPSHADQKSFCLPFFNHAYTVKREVDSPRISMPGNLG